MRVLHLDAGKSMRGGQWQVLRLVEGLERCGPGAPGAAEGDRQPAAAAEQTLLARKGSPLYEAARTAGRRVEALSLARAAIEGRRHDVIHAHDSRAHTIAAIAGGAPLVVSRRVAFAGANSLAGEWKYARPVRFIAVSEFVKSTLVDRGVPAEKIDVVYDGVPLVECREPEPGLRMVAPANADDPGKGAALAAEGARRAGVRVQFSAALERDLPGASLFLYMTYSEGLGSAALLAMSAGVPVLASGVGGLREVVRQGENGWLVENDAGAIAAAISRLTGDGDLLRRLGAGGRRTVEERFTVDLMVRRTMEVYRRVIA